MKHLYLYFLLCTFKIIGQSTLSPEFQKLFFTDLNFSKPIFIEIPAPSSLEQYQNIKNNPEIRESGIPTVHVRIGKSIKEFDKSLLTYLIENKIANIETLIQTTLNQGHGVNEEDYLFIFYNKNYSKKIFIDNTQGEAKYYLIAGHRKLSEITYQNMYEDSPLGMRRKFFSIVFNYKIISEIPSVGIDKIKYIGKGKIFQDPDDGLWKAKGDFDNLGITYGDKGEYEYISFFDSNYIPFDFEKNKNDLLLKLANQKDSIKMTEELLKKRSDSLAFMLKYPNKLLLPDSSVIYGYIIKDVINGKGIKIYKSGEKYEGELVNNKRQGVGKMKYFDGSIYEGSWLNDMKEGLGKVKFTDGQIFEGKWKEDFKEGDGKIIFPNNNILFGTWKKDSCDKYGKLVYNDGSTYDGEIILDKREGEGKMTWKNRNTYNGYWKNDKKHGKGVLKYVDGGVFSGEFYEDDYKYGFLVFKEKNTRKIWSGDFKNGVIFNGIEICEFLDCPQCAIMQNDVRNGRHGGNNIKVKKEALKKYLQNDD